MSPAIVGRPVEILLVEDNPGDVRLTLEAFKEGKVRNQIRAVGDGEAALCYLRNQPPFVHAARPDLILLDLNLPRKNGHEVLAELKADELLRRIPVVVLTTSQAERDIVGSYDLHANCFITKPVDMRQFLHVVQAIESFWLTVVRLPSE
jgi:chemotaxis family two-component system response regulator Rcp1